MNKGDFFITTRGSYSDYRVVAMFVVLEDFNKAETWAAWLQYKRYTHISFEYFISGIQKVAKEINYFEIHLGE